jgi:twitching motility protein PilT
VPVSHDDIRKLLAYCAQKGVSDVHFRVGSPPVLRIHGDLMVVKGEPYTEQDVMEACKLMVSGRLDKDRLFQQTDELDGSFDLTGVCRFRFNVFRYDNKPAAVLRTIPTRIPTVEELGMPTVIREIASIERGFVLVTGATGSGKSTTLAAMIDHLNTTRSAHVVTIEDPVEFVHPKKKCMITQREVGRDTKTFAQALRAAMRQDPDVILLGEMRDAETVDIAIKAAETGHAVFSTVHTTDASKTIGRLISLFPAEEQRMVRLRLADCLRATVSQRLVKRADGKGQLVAQEIMIVNTAIAECIADPARTHEMDTFIANGYGHNGSQTFFQHLTHLYKTGAVTLEAAKAASPNAADFERHLRYSEDTANDKVRKEVFTEEQNVISLDKASLQKQLDAEKEIQEREAAAASPVSKLAGVVQGLVGGKKK